MYEYKAKLINVTDGDTIIAELQLGFYMKATLRLRLVDVNTPEMRGASRARGVEAKAFVAAQLTGRELIVHTTKSDSFDRWLARVIVIKEDGTLMDLNKELIDRGYALPYRVGKGGA